MPEKITYLLGAGASANSIPVVNQFASGVLALSDTLNIANEIRDGYKSVCTDPSKCVYYLTSCIHFVWEIAGL